MNSWVNAAINKALIVLCLFFFGIIILCSAALNVMGEMNADLEVGRTTQYTPGSVSHDPFVRNTGGYYVDYKD